MNCAAWTENKSPLEGHVQGSPFYFLSTNRREMLQACFKESWPGQGHGKAVLGAPAQAELTTGEREWERDEDMSTIKHIKLKKALHSIYSRLKKIFCFYKIFSLLIWWANNNDVIRPTLFGLSRLNPQTRDRQPLLSKEPFLVPKKSVWSQKSYWAL